MVQSRMRGIAHAAMRLPAVLLSKPGHSSASQPERCSLQPAASFQPHRSGSVEVRATHEVMTAGTSQLALLVVQFMAAPGTPAPVFTGDTLAFRRLHGTRLPVRLLRFSTHDPCPCGCFQNTTRSARMILRTPNTSCQGATLMTASCPAWLSNPRQRAEEGLKAWQEQ